jgi:hypothetical protein
MFAAGVEHAAVTWPLRKWPQAWELDVLRGFRFGLIEALPHPAGLSGRLGDGLGLRRADRRPKSARSASSRSEENERVAVNG